MEKPYRPRRICKEPRYCQFCKEKIGQKYEYFALSCDVMDTVPTIPEIKKLYCNDCRYLTNIPLLHNVEDFRANGACRLETFPPFPNIQQLGVCDCLMLTHWNDNGDKLKEFICRNSVLFHVKLKLFKKCNGDDGFGCGKHTPRPLNGVSWYRLLAFKISKSNYICELPSRISKEVDLNAILYAPGGIKYMELAEKYKNGLENSTN